MLPPMGHNAPVARIPRYREVLVATAVRALRESLPAVPGFETERRAWLAAAVEAGGWRSVAIAAGAVSEHALPR